MGDVAHQRLAVPRNREGRWVVVCTGASLALTDPGSPGASKRRWTQRPGLGSAGAAHIQPIAVGNDLMWEGKSLSRGKEHDANLLSATTASAQMCCITNWRRVRLTLAYQRRQLREYHERRVQGTGSSVISPAPRQVFCPSIRVVIEAPR